MELEFIIEDAVANPIKFTLDSEPTGVRANFDQRRYAQTKHATVDDGKTYKQKFEKTDPIRIQFYSNFPQNRVRIVDCHDTPYGPDMFPSVAVDYRNKFYRSTCMFSSIEDKLFIYFSDTQEYTDEDFTVPGELISYEGRLPNINAMPGDLVRYSYDGVNFAAGEITEIRWNPTLQAEGYLIDQDVTLINPVQGLVEIAYDEKEANLYTQLISLAALVPGTYFIRREHGIALYDVSFTSEPLAVAEVHEETLALEYRHNGTYNREDLWNYVYLFDWTNIVRIPADFYKFAPAGEVDVDISDRGIPRMLRAIPYRQVEISFYNMPSWLADKVQMALSHDVKIINGYEWEIENFGNFETIDRLDLGTYVVSLRQKNDRAKKTDSFTIDLLAYFEPPAVSSVSPVGALLGPTFRTNTLGVFHFVSIPPGISVDKETFIDGEVVSFSVSGNPSTIPRSFTFLAVSDSLDGLTATFTINQLGAAPPAEYLDVSSYEVTLPQPSGSNQLLDVSSSGDWNISTPSGFAFTAAKESGFTKIRITAPSANPGPTARVGVVRLTLQSNPAIFKDINVTQSAPPPPPPDVMLSVSPDWIAVPGHGGSRNVNVVTANPTDQWQAVPSHSWIIVNGSIQTGSKTFNIFVNGASMETIFPRYGVVTFVNIFNADDTLIVNVEQN